MPSSRKYILNEQPTFVTLRNASFSDQTEYFDSVCGVNAMIPNEIIMEDNRPYIKIIEQPTDTFRYRYKSEKGSHGGIKGENNSRTKKSFPTVKLENCPESCREKIIIRVSLYRNEPEEKLHVYDLTGKNCSNGKFETTLDENFMAVFSTIAISTRKKEEVYEILKQRRISEYESADDPYDEDALEAEVQDEMKSINLDSAKLCFEAFFADDINTPLCDKVFSTPINNQKSAASGDLKIVRLSRCSGKCTGGDEIFLLCEKVKKEDIKVRFFEKDDEGVWEDYGVFNPAEVHHQVVIIFKTPKFYQTNVRRKVYIELLRPSDGKCSEPRQFEYIPDDDGILHPLNKKLPDAQASNNDKKEFSEIFRKRKRPKLEKDNESECFLNSSVMDSPSSTDDEVLIPKDFGFLENDISLLSTWLDQPLDDELFDVEQMGSFSSFDFNELLSPDTKSDPCTNYVKTDGPINQISTSMNSLSLSDPIYKKVLKATKDFQDGVNKILQNRKVNTYLHYAPHLLSLEDENGNSMLHIAILEQSQNWNLIRRMVEMVSKDLINHKNKFKETPLHLAIENNHVKILLLLLAKGADPNITDAEGNNCLHLAAKYGHLSCLTKLILPADGRSWEHQINNIDETNYEGMSALHIAVTENYEDCVTFLLKCKANVNFPEFKCGRTAFHLAIEHPSLMKIILGQPETDLFAKDFGGYTAVHLACLKTKKSFESISAQLKDDREKILKFFESINQNTEGDSSDSSDFEDAVEELNLVSCKDVARKTVSTDELMCTKDNKSNLMKTEEALHKYLDTNENWKKLANLIGLNVNYVAMFDRELSPGQTVLKKIKDLYHPCDLEAMIEILQFAGLEEGVQILQKNS